MTQSPLILEAFPVQLSQQRQNQFVGVFWSATIVLLLYEIYFVHPPSMLSQVATLVITIAALIPLYLWCSGRALGMPTFPLFALSFIWTYALPLASNHPKILSYTPRQHLIAATTVTGILLLGTIVWYRFVRHVPPQPKFWRTLGERKGDQFFLAALVFSVTFNVLNAAGWLASLGAFYSIFRNSALGLTAIATFVLCYRFGTRSLSKQQVRLLILLLVGFIVTDAAGFLLIGGASVAMIAIVAYTIGRKRIPIVLVVVVFTILTFLHYGKSDMRAKYWSSETPPTVAPWQYPALYVEWADFSWQYLQQRNVPADEEKESFSERASVVQMLMLAQSLSPEPLPYLKGATYSYIPQFLLPRILTPNRVRSQEGTHMLSIHYGLQTLEQTQSTSIAWGLLAEAYGNFGLLGCAGLGIALGGFYGKTTRWSINAPLLSLRSLFTILLVTFAFQAEWTAGTYIAALSQAGYVLLGIAVVFMENYRVPPMVLIAQVQSANSR